MSPEIKLRFGYWMSDKKAQKLDWLEFKSICTKNGYDLFNVDLNQPLINQGPIHIFLHKLTDIIASAKDGNVQDFQKIKKLEEYFKENPSVKVIDPIDNVRKLLDRYVCYKMIRSTDLCRYGIFTPNFCELKSKDITNISNILKISNVTYPFICKPLLGHGSKEAHEMSIIFNKKQLKECKIPCVAQSFINHNATLYKLFLVGKKYYCVERPSIKNFHNIEMNVINFKSSDVSRAGSQNTLCILDPDERDIKKNVPDPLVLEKIASTIRKVFGMDLLGVDIVISNRTSKYAIIDVNAFPGYDGFPNFFESLIECVKAENCDYNMNGENERTKTDDYIKMNMS